MKISCIIPSYNQQEYLSDAIESVLIQTHPPHEIIVVDDGSTDDSLKVARGYIGVKVISQTNKGLASARNTGIMNATGDYCLFLDADDMLLDTAVEYITNVINTLNPDIVAPSFKEFGLGSAEIILMNDPKLEDFRTGNRIGYCCAIRRSALQAVGGYSPKMVEGYEDLALTCLLLSRGYTLVTIQKVLWLYRVKEKSMYTESLQHHDKLIAQINKDIPEAQLLF